MLGGRSPRAAYHMKVTIVTDKAETEYDVPDSWQKVLKALLMHIATGAKNTPK